MQVFAHELEGIFAGSGNRPRMTHDGIVIGYSAADDSTGIPSIEMPLRDLPG
jgi:hypothetical protein